MDREMSEREAFEAWLKDHPCQYSALGNVNAAWQAACKWQRDMDAGICKVIDAEFKEPERDDFGYGCIACSEAILNQGSKE